MVKYPLDGLGMKAVNASRCNNLGQLDQGMCQRNIDMSKSSVVIIDNIDECGMRPDDVTICNRLVSLEKCDKMAICLNLKWYQGESHRVKIAERAIDLPN
jgi:hypothetical protein